MKSRNPNRKYFTEDQLLDQKDMPILRQWYKVLSEDDLKPTLTDSLSVVTSQLGKLSVLVPASDESTQTLQVLTLLEQNPHPLRGTELTYPSRPSPPLN
jgi:hypothetical protein